MTPEGAVKRAVKAELQRQCPDRYQFCPVQNGMGAPGLDFYLSVGGRFLAVETKAPGKTPTPRQRLTAEDIVRSGGTVMFVAEVDRFVFALRAWRAGWIAGEVDCL